jgi:hypothetical protein
MCSQDRCLERVLGIERVSPPRQPLISRAAKGGVMAEAAAACNRAPRQGCYSPLARKSDGEDKIGLSFAGISSRIGRGIGSQTATNREFVAMRHVGNSALFAALLLGSAGLASLGAPSEASATEVDGTWSVLVITEKGECDAAYRYAVKVANGRVSYQGDASVDMAGTVAPQRHLARRRGEQYLRRELGSRTALESVIAITR